MKLWIFNYLAVALIHPHFWTFDHYKAVNILDFCVFEGVREDVID